MARYKARPAQGQQGLCHHLVTVTPPPAGFPLPFTKDDLAFLSFCHLTYFCLA